MAGEQLALFSVPLKEATGITVWPRCEGCWKLVPTKEIQASLWGMCRECENDRLGAV